MIDAALLEMKNGKQKATPSVFWALDPRLPRTAAQAAVEFDWLIQAKHGGTTGNRSRESITFLGELLAGSLVSDQQGGEKAFVDSAGLSLFAKAYNESNQAHPLKARQELIAAVGQITASLEKARQNAEIDENTLVRMRDFCVALSNCASAYREMVYGNRQEHPYRKIQALQ